MPEGIDEAEDPAIKDMEAALRREYQLDGPTPVTGEASASSSPPAAPAPPVTPPGADPDPDDKPLGELIEDIRQEMLERNATDGIDRADFVRLFQMLTEVFEEIYGEPALFSTMPGMAGLLVRTFKDDANSSMLRANKPGLRYLLDAMFTPANMATTNSVLEAAIKKGSTDACSR